MNVTKGWKMKPTDRNIAKYFKTTVQTLTRWKTESIESKRRYDALKEHFIKAHEEKGNK